MIEIWRYNIVNKWIDGGDLLDSIYTIGYSCFKIDDFINVLKKYKINCLIDVRSNPNSMHYTDYNKTSLELLLKSNGIHYRNYKNEFGARQDNPVFYSNGFLDFTKFVKSEAFLEGVRKIVAGIEKEYVFAFMCAEKDPSTCHRNIMVAREFYRMGYKVNNILSDGTIETQENLEQRMVEHYFPNRNQLSLFQEELTWDDMVNRAYQLRNSEIGYRKDKEGDDFE